MHGGCGVNEVARRDAAAWADDGGESRERVHGGFFSDVELVEEAGRVDEVEGARGEGWAEDIACDEADRGGKFGFIEQVPARFDASRVEFEGGDAPVWAGTLAQALDPE